MNQVASHLFQEVPTEQVSLAGTDGVTGTTTLLFADNENFEVHCIKGVVIQANVLVSNWAGLVEITENKQRRGWFPDPVPFACIAGDAKQPYWLAKPKLVPGKTTLQFTFTQEGTTATVVQIVLGGYLQVK
jgi:hypothetical protein